MIIIHCTNCRTQLFYSKKRAPHCGNCGAPISAPKRHILKAVLGILFPSKPMPDKISPEPQPYVNIRAKADLLAKKCWGSRVDISSRKLHLPVEALSGLSEFQHIIQVLLRHVTRVAPNLNVPMMIPRVVIEPVGSTAGQFVEEDGWVKVVISSSFFRNVPAARAILCHEVATMSSSQTAYDRCRSWKTSG
jgi:hypothetical protein